MTTWTQFSTRRRVNVDRFVSGLPDAAESTVRARLVELGVDPSTFPWHDLAVNEPQPEPEAVEAEQLDDELEVEDDSPVEVQDG
jgi:hypothetical protein